jgi:molybdopterin/thiamine biosynthesis adenylyltransferase
MVLYRLLNSRILISPANGPNTELAKNLILAGVNVTMYDDAIATEDDF